MKIIIDAGHGGKDPGAIGPSGKKEKDINLKVAKLIQFLLSYLDYEVVLTRNDDAYPEWKERVKSKSDDLYISIHCNASNNPRAAGIETFCYTSSEEGKELAELVQANLIKGTGRVDRGVKENENLYVLKNTKCPAVLAEIGFISNIEEEVLLNCVEYQVEVSLAIVKAVDEFVRSRKSNN
jgi:N-acetylmuramoyl-L-alanine amidase